VERGRARGARHRIGLRRTKKAFGAHGRERNFVQRSELLVLNMFLTIYVYNTRVENCF
jgi:hypothetical protein